MGFSGLVLNGKAWSLEVLGFFVVLPAVWAIILDSEP